MDLKNFKVLSKAEYEALSEREQVKYELQLEEYKKVQAEDAANKAAEAAVEKATKTITEELETVKGELQVVKDEAEKQKTELEEKMAELNRIKVASKEAEKSGQTFEDALNKGIEEHTDDLKKLITDKKGEVRFQLKAVGTMGLNSIEDIDLANAQLRPGIAALPNRRIHMRTILNTGRMTTSDYHYLREVGGEGDVGIWSENSGVKPQLDLDYIEKIAPSQYIAGWLQISRKSLDDVVALRSALAPRLLEKYLQAEDFQVLQGDGTGNNLEGILEVATPYDGNEPYLVSEIIDAIGQLEEGVGGLTDGFYADGVILKPRDWARIANTVSKGTEQVFTLPNGVGIVNMVNGILYLNGVPVYKINGMPGDTPGRKFLVGDFLMGAQLLIREDPTVVFSYENDQNFVRNEVTVRVEGRVALPIYYEEAFVQGDIAPISA